MEVLEEEFGDLSQKQLLAPVDTVEVRPQAAASLLPASAILFYGYFLINALFYCVHMLSASMSIVL